VIGGMAMDWQLHIIVNRVQIGCYGHNGLGMHGQRRRTHHPRLL
jgi:hypothetical protein